MATPQPAVARTLAAGLLIALAFVHFLTLPHGFSVEAYIGVFVMLASGMALAGGLALVANDRDREWWYALTLGVLNALGFLLSRISGLPLADFDVEGNWFRGTGLALAFVSLVVTGVAGWVLAARRRARKARHPVVSARDRSSSSREQDRR